MSDQSTNLQLPFLQAGQAQKHVTVNESLLLFDALVQMAVASATTLAQPASPADGSVYILPAGKTGADWGAMANDALAYYRDGAWTAISPREGFVAWCKDSDKFSVFNGTTWGDLGVAGAAGAFSFSGDLTPAQISADQHDYNPAGLSGAAIVRLSSDARRAITGIQSGADGRVLFLARLQSDHARQRFDCLECGEPVRHAERHRTLRGGDGEAALRRYDATLAADIASDVEMRH